MPVEKRDKVYYARALINVDVFDLYDLIVRTVGDTWFTAYDDKSKQVFLFNYSDIGKRVFMDRKEALDVLNEKKKNRKKVSSETCYEEY
jgi:hypothetical protein